MRMGLGSIINKEWINIYERKPQTGLQYPPPNQHFSNPPVNISYGFLTLNMNSLTASSVLKAHSPQ